MSSETFADLGVSRPVAGRTRRARHHRAIRGPETCASRTSSPARTSSSSRRPARARRSPSASRWSSCIEADARRPAALVLAPDPRARRARSSTSCGRSPHVPGPEDRRRLRRRRAPGAGQAAAQRPHRGRHARPARGPARARRLQPRSRSRSSSSTRPTACSTWASSPPSTGSSPRCPAIARRCSSRRRSRAAAGKLAAAYTRNPRRHVHKPEAETGRRHRAPLRPPRPTRPRSDALVDELRDDERGRTLVFVRTKRGADRLVKRLGHQKVRAVAMHGNKSQSQRREGARRLRARRRATPWSRPTSPPAGSTSRTSPT